MLETINALLTIFCPLGLAAEGADVKSLRMIFRLGEAVIGVPAAAPGLEKDSAVEEDLDIPEGGISGAF